jgi:hypothetical protein
MNSLSEKLKEFATFTELIGIFFFFREVKGRNFPEKHWTSLRA